MQNVETNEINVYNIMQQQLEETFSAPDAGPISNDGLEGRAYRKAVICGFLKENRETLVVGCIFALCAVHMFLRIIFYGIGIVRIDTAYTTGSLISCIAATLVPLLNWVYSTKIKTFSFHRRKFMLLRFCAATFAVMMMTYIYHHAGNVLIPLVVTLFKPTVSRSVSMVKMFCRGLMFLVSAVPAIAIYVMISRFTRDEIRKYQIINFDISMMIDLRDREKREFAYDLKIVKDLGNGKPYVIKEKDRFLHALDDGTTGTGKTSSTFTPAIDNDFYQRRYNLEHQKMGVEKLLAAGRVRMACPMEDQEFDIDNFIPLDDKAKGELYKLKYKSPLASIIAVAPNEAFSDEIYELARANGQAVNRLDPMLSVDGRLKEGFIGLNPLYIKPGLSEVQYLIEVNQRATLFADVMQAVYDKTGQSNPYFAGLNQNITTSVTALILLCAPYMPEKFADKGLAPTPADVQDVLNDFTKARVYDKVFLNRYAKPGSKYDSHPDFGKLQYIYDVVHGRLLGADSSQLFDQCQGLRNIINQLLGNPLICNVLCSQHTIDLDHVLADGEIVLVNYALNLGSDGITLGLFFLLSLIQAAYRRPAPESERLPCFIYVDELPQLLHPRLEACFALFRQYRMAMFVAIQSLAQLRKTRDTAFLEQVLLGNCAHHFVFGRAGVEDMEIYMSLAGTRLEAVLTESRNETSLFAANPTVSYQHRFTNQRVNNIEGSDIRNLKFQECLLITVNDGTPVAAFKAIVFFLPRWKRTHHKRYECDWNSYYDESAEKTKDIPVDKDPTEEVIVIPRQTISTDQMSDMNRLRVDLHVDESSGQEVSMPSEGGAKSAAHEPAHPIADPDPENAGTDTESADSNGFFFSAGTYEPDVVSLMPDVHSIVQMEDAGGDSSEDMEIWQDGHESRSVGSDPTIPGGLEISAPPAPVPITMGEQKAGTKGVCEPSYESDAADMQAEGVSSGTAEGDPDILQRDIIEHTGAPDAPDTNPAIVETDDEKSADAQAVDMDHAMQVPQEAVSIKNPDSPRKSETGTGGTDRGSRSRPRKAAVQKRDKEVFVTAGFDEAELSKQLDDISDMFAEFL